MATKYSVFIDLQTKGAGTTSKQIEKMGNQSKIAANSLNFLKSTLEFLAIGLGTTEILKAADGWTNFSNSIMAASSAGTNLVSTQNSLFEISQRTSTSIESTSGIYRALALNMDALGASQKNLLTVTKALSEGMSQSGSTIAQQQGGVIELGEVFDLGTLQARQFRSVMQDFPALGVRLKKFFLDASGGTETMRAQMLKGEITSKAFFNAVLQIAPALDSMQSSMQRTNAQGVVRLDNAFEKLIGAMDSVLQESTGFNSFADVLTSSMDDASNGINSMNKVLRSLNIDKTISQPIIVLKNNIHSLNAELGNFTKKDIFQPLKNNIHSLNAELENFTKKDIFQPIIVLKNNIHSLNAELGNLTKKDIFQPIIDQFDKLKKDLSNDSLKSPIITLKLDKSVFVKAMSGFSSRLGVIPVKVRPELLSKDVINGIKAIGDTVINSIKAIGDTITRPLSINLGGLPVETKQFGKIIKGMNLDFHQFVATVTPVSQMFNTLNGVIARMNIPLAKTSVILKDQKQTVTEISTDYSNYLAQLEASRQQLLGISPIMQKIKNDSSLTTGQVFKLTGINQANEQLKTFLRSSSEISDSNADVINLSSSYKKLKDDISKAAIEMNIAAINGKKVEASQKALNTIAGDKSIITLYKNINELSNDFASSVANSMAGLITGTLSASEAFKQMASSIISDMIRMGLEAEALNAIKGIGRLFGAGGFFGAGAGAGAGGNFLSRRSGNNFLQANNNSRTPLNSSFNKSASPLQLIINTNVTSNTTGTGTSDNGKTQNQQAADISKLVNAKITENLIKESRVGGLLHKANG